jgi:hypothetical protein
VTEYGEIYVEHWLIDLFYTPMEPGPDHIWDDNTPLAFIACPFLAFKPQVTYDFDDNFPFFRGVFFLPRRLPQPSHHCLSVA